MNQEDIASSEDLDEISLIDLVAVLIKRRSLIALITVAAAFFSAVFAVGSMLLPPEKSYLPNLYSPKAVILVGESGGGLSSMLGEASGLAALAGLNIGGSKSNGELVVMLAKSNSTLDELNAEFNLTARYKIKKSPLAGTRKAILEHYAVTYDSKTGTVSITFEDIDPEFGKRFVNRAVEILDRRYAALAVNKAGTQKISLEKKLADVQKEINKLETKVRDFTTRYGVISVEALATEQITVLARFRSELIMKDMEIENYEKVSNVDDPVIRRLRAEREGVVQKLAELEAGTSVLPSQKSIPTIAFEYASLQRDLAVQMEIFKTLTQQYELSKIEAENKAPAFQVLEFAEVPDQKSGPSRSMIVIVATFAGLIGAILLAFILKVIEDVRNDPAAMRKLKGQA